MEVLQIPKEQVIIDLKIITKIEIIPLKVLKRVDFIQV